MVPLQYTLGTYLRIQDSVLVLLLVKFVILVVAISANGRVLHNHNSTISHKKLRIFESFQLPYPRSYGTLTVLPLYVHDYLLFSSFFSFLRFPSKTISYTIKRHPKSTHFILTWSVPLFHHDFLYHTSIDHMRRSFFIFHLNPIFFYS